MKRFVKLFFTLILISSTAICSISATKPSFAEEIPETSEASETPGVPESPETPAETNGEEWDGIIKDPTPEKKPTPKPNPNPTVITNIVTTVTPPKTTTKTTTVSTVSTVSTVTESTPTETPLEAPVETSAQPEQTESQTPQTPEIPEIPNTFTPNTTNAIDNGTTRKITLLALISTAIVYFLSIEIWGLTKLAKTIKNEKLIKTAKKKAAKVKETKLTRSTD